MSSSTIIEAAVTGLLSSGTLVAAWAKWFDHRDKKRDTERALQRDRDETWFKEADEAYRRVQQECSSCNQRLNTLSHRFYRLMAALDDMCDMAENGSVRIPDLRQAVRTARQEP
jgi:hypothetical protein